jgi:hypothetical protein
VPLKGVRTPRRLKGRACQVCRHPERGRIDYLLVVSLGTHGAGRRVLAAKFGVSRDSLARHGMNHISEEYRRSVRIGPFESEDHLRKLCAEAGTSVLERFNAIYSGLSNRWLAAFEIGNDDTLCRLSGQMQANLAMQARLTKELLPPGAHTEIQNNFYLSPEIYNLQRRALSALRRHPEALKDFIRAMRPPQAQVLIEGGTW